MGIINIQSSLLRKLRLRSTVNEPDSYTNMNNQTYEQTINKSDLNSHTGYYYN